ncbi:MAG: hypothetical protein K8I02_08055 [Candidatus Methylomirabilis sp.]|nr:hypothetical protein [Deltaproteobacteria bacterium]
MAALEDSAAFGFEEGPEEAPRPLAAVEPTLDPRAKSQIRLRAWKLHGVARAQRRLVDYLDQEIPGTLNRMLDVSGPVCCRRTVDSFLPGVQAIRYSLGYEAAGRAVTKELLLAPLYIGRESLDDAIAEDAERCAWDAVVVHDEVTTRYAVELDLTRDALEPLFRLRPELRLPLGPDLGRRLRAFFRGPLQDRLR